ncbi:imidazole glycerol phosphate synthase subunit HisF, partial [Escherichia coli]
DLLKACSEITKRPMVASGGAGKSADFIELFQLPKIEAGLAASIFHYGEVKIPELKKQLQAVDIPVRIV